MKHFNNVIPFHILIKLFGLYYLVAYVYASLIILENVCESITMSLVGSESAVGETYESPIVHRIAPTNSSNVIFEVKPFSCEFENGVDVNDEHVLKMFTRESCPLKKLDESELSDVSVLSLPNVFLDKTFIDEIELCHSKWFDTKLSSQRAKFTISERRMQRKLSDMWKKSHNMVLQ